MQRATRQRAALIGVLSDSSKFRTARQLHEQLTAQGESVGMATVYRGLQSLASAGEIDVLRTDDGESLYRRCAQGHHHHLICRTCGAASEISGPSIERWALQVAAAHGYVDPEHTVEIFGTCQECVTPRRRPAARA